MNGSSWRSAFSGLFVAVFLNAVGFRTLTASALWPGPRGAAPSIAAAKAAPMAARLVPARKLRRRRHQTGQAALPPRSVEASAQPSKILKLPDQDGDSAKSREPSALDHPPA